MVLQQEANWMHVERARGGGGAGFAPTCRSGTDAPAYSSGPVREPTPAAALGPKRTLTIKAATSRIQPFATNKKSEYG